MASTAAKSYEPEYEDTLNVEMELSEDEVKHVMTSLDKTSHLTKEAWNGIVFEFELQRVNEADEEQKDLLLHVHVNRNARDPHWQCSFRATVQCDLAPSNFSETLEQDMTASRISTVLIMPLLRLPSETITSAKLNISIRMTSWSGVFPKLRHSFNKKTPLTDGTLIVQGTPLYVTRSELAKQSSEFYNIFFPHSDTVKNEYIIDDVSPATMTVFLRLICQGASVEEDLDLRMTDVEQMLSLAERFDCESVKRIMERYLMSEYLQSEMGLGLPRCLLLSDRYRLSAACSKIMHKVTDEEKLRDLHQSPDYKMLSEALKAAILDMATEQRALPAVAARDLEAATVLWMINRVGGAEFVEAHDPATSAYLDENDYEPLDSSGDSSSSRDSNNLASLIGPSIRTRRKRARAGDDRLIPLSKVVFGPEM